MNQSGWSGCCDPGAPLVVIGAGRSGSSLLARIFGAHPAMCFDDENDFLTPKLWRLIWENRRPRPIFRTLARAAKAVAREWGYRILW